MKHPALQSYEAILTKWDRRVRLIGNTLRDGIGDDTLHDSRLLAAHLSPVDSFVDIGSGNGLPAIPALIFADAPPASATLVEADQRKAAFLRAARREIGLTYEVFAMRVEESPYLGATLISAKAFAPLPRLLELAVPHLAPGGRILAFKGRQAEVEIADAARTWDFELEREGRNAQTGAVLLVIRNPQRRNAA